jgi:hypothetical protein
MAMCRAEQTVINIGLVGMKVFRCGADKRPQTRRGFKDAMLWRRTPSDWPRAGVPTGAINGIDVLDVDTKNGATDWWWQHFEAMPRTRMQVTESGGYHVFFRHAEGLKCSQGRIAKGVDVRADGGYVLDWSREGLPVANCDVFSPWPEWLLAAAMGMSCDQGAKPNDIPDAGLPILDRSSQCTPAAEGRPVCGPVIAGQGFVRTKPGWRKVRLAGLARMVEREPVGNRNGVLLFAACRMAEMCVIERKTQWAECVELLVHASRMNGQWAEPNGPAKVMATIGSGLKLIEAKYGRNEH